MLDLWTSEATSSLSMVWWFCCLILLACVCVWPCSSGSAESWPLDHQGSPAWCHFLPSRPLLSDSCPYWHWIDLTASLWSFSHLYNFPWSQLRLWTEVPTKSCSSSLHAVAMLLALSAHWYPPGIIIKIPFARNLLVDIYRLGKGTSRENSDEKCSPLLPWPLGPWGWKHSDFSRESWGRVRGKVLLINVLKPSVKHFRWEPSLDVLLLPCFPKQEAKHDFIFVWWLRAIIKH